MANCHIAHDCFVGDHAVLANFASLAGHVHVGDHATLGGFVGVHQFVKVGAHVMVAAAVVLFQDVPPYVTIGGIPPAPHGINSEGLKRRGFSAEDIAALKQAYRTLYKSGLTIADAQAELEKQAAEAPPVRAILDFLATSTRGILR
jgi:UDP-N-acetylglucosamine acyltransferase